MRKHLLCLLPAASLASFVSLHADVTLPPLISDNMLLQQSQAAVWGKASPGEKVTVTLGSVSASTTAGGDGTWNVKLIGLKPGIAGDLKVVGNNTLTVSNVAVGDVWFASGQSNMEFRLRHCRDAEKAMAVANSQEIRMFTVPRLSSETPVEELKGKWEVATPQTVGDWSGVGYFFARKLHADLGIPIGVIQSSWGGTNAQAWTPVEVANVDPRFKKSYEGWQKNVAEYPETKAAFDKKLAEWRVAADAAKAAGMKEPSKPPTPLGPGMGGSPCALYNGMVYGATSYPIKGVIWYQGESNADQGTAKYYETLLSGMISSWRNAWGVGEFPFLIVQLANYMETREEPSDSLWAELRDSQRLIASKAPSTGLAIALDIGEAKDIHPKNKEEVGRRLALVAEAKAYGKEVVYSGPFFDAVVFNDGQATITFAAGTAAGLTTTDGGAVKGFALAGEDKKFVWADATIVGASAVVRSEAVPNPVAVRYAWADNPDINLVNEAGLPASSFRSDDWPQKPTPRVPKK